MSAWQLRATVLPDEQARDLWVTADRIRFTPLPDAQTLHQGGYVLPGLVDTHTHPGTVEIGEPLDEDQLRADAAAHISSGTALIRVPGSASRLPAWFGDRKSTRLNSSHVAISYAVFCVVKRQRRH